MTTIGVYNPRTEFSRLIERALAGEELVITRRGKPVVRLVPIEESRPHRQPGALRGLFEVTDEFFEPLPDEIIDAFYESRIFQTRSESPSQDPYLHRVIVRRLQGLARPCGTTTLRRSGSRRAQSMTNEAIHRPQLSHCATEVREHDPDRYLATLFAPPAARETLFALYAFDHEIAKVRHVVREPVAGLVRFQWWRDALDGIAAGNPPAQPVVAALQACWAVFAPLRPRLDAAIDGRELELSAEPPPDLATLEQRLDAGCGEITVAAVDLLGASEAPAHAAARHLGLALGLIRLVQALPADLDRERIRVPSALLDRHEIDLEASGQGRDGRVLAPAVAELAARARAHLRDARRYRRDVPKQALAALLHATLLEHYLERLARARHDPFAHVPTRPAGSALLRLLGRHLLGRY